MVMMVIPTYVMESISIKTRQILYINLNLTCFYVRGSGFGFQRYGSFNAEIIFTSLARGVPPRRSLCLGLASCLFDHGRISAMMSRNVFCSREIGC